MKTVLSFCMCWLLVAAPALAHLGLAITVPEHDAILARAPTLIHFEFMATMRLTNVQLEFSAGERLGERIAVRLPRDESGVSTVFGESVDLALPDLDPGSYVLYWQALSLDGYQLLDDLSFTVLPPA